MELLLKIEGFLANFLSTGGLRSFWEFGGEWKGRCSV